MTLRHNVMHLLAQGELSTQTLSGNLVISGSGATVKSARWTQGRCGLTYRL